MRLEPAGPEHLQVLHRATVAARDALLAGLDAFTLQVGSTSTDLPPLGRLLTAFLDASRDAEIAEYHLDDELKKAKRADPNQPDDTSHLDAGNTKDKAPDEARGYSVRDLRNAAGELANWLDSTAGRAFCSPLYFLVGPAGSGKTHLFVDATNQALESERPAVVLFGPQFTTGGLWAGICDQLGLPPLGRDELLGAMDSAAEASGLAGRRFVIHVDALNETDPAHFWGVQLPVLRAAVAQWPHIALAVSCRDTFVQVVDRDDERSHYVSRTHPGFGGREVEATQKYFAHYGLAAPRIPLLAPEFSLPLFLRLYCESLAESGSTEGAVGHEGRIRIFERYLAAKLEKVARRHRSDASSGYELDRALHTVTAVVDALLDEMATQARESIPIASAEDLAIAAAGGSAKDATVILGALQSEGVLSREFIYHRDVQPEAGFRIVFQAFSDFLILRRRLESVTEPAVDGELLTWLNSDDAYGVREAASITLPERYGVELLDLLAVSLDDLDEPERADEGAWDKHMRAMGMYRSFVEMLPYREPSSITDRTIELLNDAMHVVSPTDLFNAIFQMAPQPDNPLNGEGLHSYLIESPMPKRDEHFGIAMYREIWTEASPTATLARWASNGPYHDYEPRVIELACIPLIWLLGSPNRFMRDWVTKALVQLLRGHLGVASQLLERFWHVDDPYVVQRVVLIVYGALMRTDLSCADDAQTSNAKTLATTVHKLVFTKPVRPDELMLDAARGVVQLGVRRGLLPKTALHDIERPYGLPAPSIPPTQKTLEAKYKPEQGTPDEESYSTVFRSLFGFLSDFGRYVVESTLNKFSRYRLNKPYPAQEPRPEPTFSSRRWAKFLHSLSSEQTHELTKHQTKTDGHPDDPTPVDQLVLNLTPQQARLFSDVRRRPKRTRRNADYPTDQARRWVFTRALDLGWAPDLFGRFDSEVGHSDGRSEHKAERWGKKYQWMAFHELVARVADNFHPRRDFYGEAILKGVFRVPGVRDIDPSVPPVPYRSFAVNDGQPGATWGPPPIVLSPWPPAPIDFPRYKRDIDAFLADQASESTLDRVLLIEDSHGRPWVLLDAQIEQNDPSADEGWRGLRQIVAISSWFCPKEQAVTIQPHLGRLRRSSHELVDDYGHSQCCYAGEVGWSLNDCGHRHAELRDLDLEGHTWKLVNTTESTGWEWSALDCSIEGSVAATVPSSFIQSRAQLTHDDRGPSWSADGETVFTNYGRRRDLDIGHALLARADWLAEFMTTHDIEMVAASWHERMNLRDDWGRHDPIEQVWSGARLGPDLSVHLANEIRERHSSSR